jgi:hypothetical protein
MLAALVLTGLLLNSHHIKDWLMMSIRVAEQASAMLLRQRVVAQAQASHGMFLPTRCLKYQPTMGSNPKLSCAPKVHETEHRTEQNILSTVLPETRQKTTSPCQHAYISVHAPPLDEKSSTPSP